MNDAAREALLKAKDVERQIQELEYTLVRVGVETIEEYNQIRDSIFNLEIQAMELHAQYRKG